MAVLANLRGADDYAPASRHALELIASGDLAGYDPEWFGSPDWIAFWREHGETLMHDVLAIIKEYEALRARAGRARRGKEHRA